MQLHRIFEQQTQKEETPVELKEYMLEFQIENSVWVISFKNVCEVVDSFPYTEYPTQVNNHLGVINLRGSVIPIVQPFNEMCSQGKYIIFETDDGRLLGILVSETKKIEIDKSLSSTGIYNLNNRPVKQIDLNYIIDRIQGGSNE